MQNWNPKRNGQVDPPRAWLQNARVSAQSLSRSVAQSLGSFRAQLAVRPRSRNACKVASASSGVSISWPFRQPSARSALGAQRRRRRGCEFLFNKLGGARQPCDLSGRVVPTKMGAGGHCLKKSGRGGSILQSLGSPTNQYLSLQPKLPGSWPLSSSDGAQGAPLRA